MKINLATIVILLCFVVQGISCSMYKVTQNGKTIVGNNEDWISPNSQFWYEPGKGDDYGVMYMGLLNNFAQGGINEVGLVFDGFANPFLEIKDVENKAQVPISWAVHHAMSKFENVQEVHDYMATVNLSALASSMLVFVDRTGKYLIVEGDELIIGDEEEKVFSNFYYSQVESVDKVELENVKNGLAYLKEADSEASFDFCGSVMNSLSSVNGMTQYSTIYDLERLTISVYLYHSYEEYIEIDLKQELKKGKHKTMIADFFSDTAAGSKYYAKYNDVNDPTAYYRDRLEDKDLSEQELIKQGFPFVFNWIGYEWMIEKNNPIAAIEMFEFAIQKMPSVANLHDSLGEAYYKMEITSRLSKATNTPKYWILKTRMLPK